MHSLKRMFKRRGGKSKTKKGRGKGKGKGKGRRQRAGTDSWQKHNEYGEDSSPIVEENIDEQTENPISSEDEEQARIINDMIAESIDARENGDIMSKISMFSNNGNESENERNKERIDRHLKHKKIRDDKKKSLTDTPSTSQYFDANTYKSPLSYAELAPYNLPGGSRRRRMRKQRKTKKVKR
jgi:hypothetical protein